MEQNQSAQSPGAATDEPASPSHPDALDFDPVPLRHREDGLDSGQAARICRGAGRLRHCPACGGPHRSLRAGGQPRPPPRRCPRLRPRLRRGAADRRSPPRSVAFERAIEGTVKRHTYHGEIVSEERVYDNRLLMSLIGKLPDLFEARCRAEVERDWQPWMEAVEQGLPEPVPGEAEGPPLQAKPEPDARQDACEDEWKGDEVWEQEDQWWTSFPPPAGFDGEESRGPFGFDYARTLTDRELAVIEADQEADLAEEAARRDRYFGFSVVGARKQRGRRRRRRASCVRSRGWPADRWQRRPDRRRGFAAAHERRHFFAQDT